MGQKYKVYQKMFVKWSLQVTATEEINEHKVQSNWLIIGFEQSEAF